MSSTSTSSSPPPARERALEFKHKNEVQKWLDIIRGSYAPTQVDNLKLGTAPAVPYSDVRLLPYLQHSFWFCRTSPRVRQWRTCSPRSTTLSGTTTRCSPSLALRRVWARCIAARALGDRQRFRHEDDHALVRQAHDRRHGPAVVVDLDASQPQVTGDLLPGGLPGSVTMVDQEPERRQPGRRRDPQAGLLCVRLRADEGSAPALRLRHRALPERAEPGEGRRRTRLLPARARLRRLRI